MPSPEDYARQAQRLSRRWKRGKLTTEQFQIESLKIALDLKEYHYLRAASDLLDAKKLLERWLASPKRFRGAYRNVPPDVVEETRAFLAQLRKESAAGE